MLLLVRVLFYVKMTHVETNMKISVSLQIRLECFFDVFLATPFPVIFIRICPGIDLICVMDILNALVLLHHGATVLPYVAGNEGE